MTKRIKYSLITFLITIFLVLAGIFAISMPTTTASAATQATLSNFSIGSTNTQNHVQLVAGSGEMPADFVTYGQSNNLAATGDNGSTFGTVSKWREDTSWWGIVGVLVADSTTFNIFPPSGQAVIGDHLMIPQGAMIATATDSVVFGEQVDLWFNGASWQMTEPVVLSDFTFGTNNGAGYFDIVPTNGSIPEAIVSSNANLSIAGGTFGSSSTWTRDGGATTVNFPSQVGVLASTSNNFQIFPSGATAQAGDVITIPQGATIIVNGYCVAFADTITVTFNGTKWEGLGEYEAPSTPMTISAIESNSTYNGTMYQLYVTVDVSATATWTGWDNNAHVSLNGVSTKADGWCFNNTHSLYMQLTTSEVANPLTFVKGTILTINGTRYKIANDFNVYYYDGALHTETKPVATPMTITEIDTTRTVYASNMYQIYVMTNVKNTGATWGGWDNSTQVSVNGTMTRADWCFASDVLLYVQVATADVANPITIVKGTQVTINGILYEISADFNIYHYDDGFHTEPKPVATPMTITGIAENTVYDTANDWYGLYVTTNVKNTGATWGGWDNSAQVSVNGTMTRADWCFASDILLYVQVATADVANPITIVKGTQVTINNVLYEISTDFNIYHYDGGFHTTEKVENTMVTITMLGATGHTYSTINFGSTGGTSTFEWSSTTAEYNGVQTTITIVWENTTLIQVGLINNKTWVEGDTFKLLKGQTFTQAGITYEFAQDYTVYYYNNQWNDAFGYKVTKTIDGNISTEYVQGDYTLPNVAKDGYIHLGWIYNEALYEIGDAFTAPATVEGFAIEAVYVDFTQLDGASIKIGNEVSGSGIRFTARLGELNKYVAQVGVLVMPVDLMTNGELTHTNYAIYDENTNTGICQEFIAKASELSLETFQNFGEAYYVKGSIVNLFESNYQRTFTGRSFLIVNYADGEKYVYVDYNASENQRRICDVAKSALDDENATYTTAQKKILLGYTAKELITYAYFGPTETSDFENYANLDMDVIWLDMIPYRAHERYATPWNADLESWLYNEPATIDRDLKSAIAAAKMQGLKVIVYDVGIRRLSESTIPLIAENPANPQLLGLWLQTGDSETAEIFAADADESAFDQANMTYTYSGSNFAGTGKAKVLKYLYQFESEVALKEYISILMGQYAKESNFYGVMLADEPTEDMYAQLALVKKIIAELYPNAYTQSCQLPSYYYDNFATFKTTIENYASQVQGHGDLGLDFYPFLEENLSIWDQIFGTDTKTEDGIRINWLATMQYVAQMAVKYDLDFENTIQSHAMSDGYTNVSAAELALQVHMSLAFGADKLSYFTYNQHDEAGLTMTQYINNDAKLAAAVKVANTNGDYLKKHMTAFEYSKSKIYGATSNCLNTDNFTSSDLTKDIIALAENSVLVNEFYNEITGEYGYYIVNITIPDNDTSVTIALNGNATIYQNGASASTSSITLAAGEGAFVVVS